MPAGPLLGVRPVRSACAGCAGRRSLGAWRRKPRPRRGSGGPPTAAGTRFEKARYSSSAKTKSPLPPTGRFSSGIRSAGIMPAQLAPPAPTGTATYCRPSTA